MPAHRSSRRANPKYTFSDDEDEESSRYETCHKYKPLPEPLIPAVPSPRSSHSRKRPPSYIRRPRNAFIIFRTAFYEQHKMKENGIESDHRHISRIAAHVWNNLPEDKKEVYKAQAETEKLAHKAAYPNYRYTPVGKPRQIKRKAKRDDSEDQLRCRQLAELVISGVEGSDLRHAVQALDDGVVKVELTHKTSQASCKKVTPASRRAPRLPAVEDVALVDVNVKEGSPPPRYLGLLSPLSDTDQESRGSSDGLNTPGPSSTQSDYSPTSKSSPDAEVSRRTPYHIPIDDLTFLASLSDLEQTPNPHMRPTATSNLMLASLCPQESAPPSPAGATYMPLPPSFYPSEDVYPSLWPELHLPFSSLKLSSTPPPARHPMPPGHAECGDDHDVGTPTRHSPFPVTFSPWSPSVDSETPFEESMEELSLRCLDEYDSVESFTS